MNLKSDIIKKWDGKKIAISDDIIKKWSGKRITEKLKPVSQKPFETPLAEEFKKPEKPIKIQLEWTKPEKETIIRAVRKEEKFRDLTEKEKETADLLREIKYLKNNAPFEVKAKAFTTQVIRNSPVGIIGRIISGKKFDEYIERDKAIEYAFPYYAMAGQYAGEWASLITTGKILGKIPIKLTGKMLPTVFEKVSTPILAAITGSASGGAIFGISQLAEEIAKAREEKKIDVLKSAKRVAESSLMGAGLGSLWAIENPIKSIVASSVYGAGINYLFNKDYKQSAISGLMFGLLTAATHKNMSKLLRDIAYQRTIDGVKTYIKLKKPKAPDWEVEVLSREFLNDMLIKNNLAKVEGKELIFKDNLTYKHFESATKNVIKNIDKLLFNISKQAKVSTVKPIPKQNIKDIVEKAGGKFLGVKDNLVYFNEPKTKSTLALPVNEANLENIKNRIIETQKKVEPQKKVEKPKMTFEEIQQKEKLMGQLKSEPLNYPQSAIERMSLKTAKEIIEKSIPYKKVSILPDGSYKIIEKQPEEKEISKPSVSKKEQVEMKEPWEMTKEEYKNLPIEQWGEITGFVEYSKLSPKIKKVAQEKYLKETGDIEGANPKSEEFILDKFIFDKKTGEIFSDDYPSHKEEVEWALKQGKPVPAEILKDYPDLVEKYKAKQVVSQIESVNKIKDIREYIKANYKGISENDINIIEKDIGTLTNKYSKYLKSPQTDKDELLSASFIGLDKALKTFDKSKGASLRTHINNYIKGEIRDWLSENENLIKVNRTYESKIKKAIKQLQNEGIEPTIEKISELSGIKKDTVRDIIEVRNIISEMVDEEEGVRKIEQIKEEKPTPEEAVAKEELVTRLKEEISKLSNKEKEIFEAFSEDKSVSYISKKVGISEEEAVNTLKNVRKKLIKNLELEDLIYMDYAIGSKEIKKKEERGSIRFKKIIELDQAKIKSKKSLKEKENIFKKYIEELFSFYPELKNYPVLQNDIRKYMGRIHHLQEIVFDLMRVAIFGDMSEEEIYLTSQLIFDLSDEARIKAKVETSGLTLEEVRENIKKRKNEFKKLGIDKKVDRAIEKYKEYIEIIRETLIEIGVLKPEQNFDFYAPHNVLNYINPDFWQHWEYIGISRRFRKFKPSFAKKAKGTTKEYLRSPIALFTYFAKALKTIEDWKFLNDILDRYDITKNWEVEDYVKFINDNIPDKAIEKFLKDKNKKSLEDINIKSLRGFAFDYKEDIVINDKQYRTFYPTSVFLSTGRSRPPDYKNKPFYVVPKEIADTLNNFYPPSLGGIRLLNKATAIWKTAAIFWNYPSFTLNNIIGDTFIVLVQHPEPWELSHDISVAIRYLFSQEARNTDLKELRDFIIDEAVLDGLMITSENLYSATSPIEVFKKLNKLSMYRESLLRIAMANYCLRKLKEGKASFVREHLGHLDIPELNDRDAMGHIARSILVDYQRWSPIFKRYVRGLAVPFGTFYFGWTNIWWKFQFSKKDWWKALAGGFLPYIIATLWNYSSKERRKIEAKLPRDKAYDLHFILSTKPEPDGTYRIWDPQNPVALVFGGSIYGASTKAVARVTFEGISIKKASNEFLKQIFGEEKRRIVFLATPAWRFIKGLVDRRDPYDRAPIYPRRKEDLTTIEEIYYNFLYFAKTFSPPFANSIRYYVRGMPLRATTKKLFSHWSIKRVLGIYNINLATGFLTSIFTEEELERLSKKEKDIFEKLSWDTVREINNLTKKAASIFDSVLRDFKNKSFDLVKEEVEKTYDGKYPTKRNEILNLYYTVFKKYWKEIGQEKYSNKVKKVLEKAELPIPIEKISDKLWLNRFINRIVNPSFIYNLAYGNYEIADKNTPEKFYYGNLKKISRISRFIQVITRTPSAERALTLKKLLSGKE